MKNQKENQITNKINKKGISTVVASVLLIMVSIVALTLVWTAIRPMIATSLSPQISCIELQSESAIKINSACYNNNTKELELLIERSQKSELSEIKFTISSDNNYRDFICSSNSEICANCQLPEKGETKKYFFLSNSQTPPSRITIKSDSCILDTKEIVLC